MATNPPRWNVVDQRPPPKESTRWLLERMVAFLNLIMVLLMVWFGSTVLSLEKKAVELSSEQGHLIKAVDIVIVDIKSIQKSVIKLEVVAERKLHDNH